MPSGRNESAPAKVNLALHVVGRRSDGYHELHSLVVFADVADELEAIEAAGDGLRITGPFADGLANDDSNLVRRAVAAFRRRWPHAVANGVGFHLRKNLPVSAGLGGGSADAAAALRVMAAMSAEPIRAADLYDVATQLGADVPVCLASRPAEVTGIGEGVRPLPDFPALHLVLINPMLAVSTGEVFTRLGDQFSAPLPTLPTALDRASDLTPWLMETRNDLEPTAVAIAPVIGDLIAGTAATAGCMQARMSGSGATVFGLFGSSAQAQQAAHELRRRWPGYWIAAARLLRP